MEKIDIHNTEVNYEQALENLKAKVSANNYRTIVEFLDAAALGKTARKNARKKQKGKRTRLKFVYLLQLVANFFNKDIDKPTVKDMESFVKALNDDKIRKKNGLKYSEQVKADIKMAYINYLNYFYVIKKKDIAMFAELTDWIETTFKEKETTAPTEEEVKKMLAKCITLQQKVLIVLLFDLGARAEEFLNIRLSDVIEVKDQIPYYKITLRSEFSKTNGRTINLFWKPTTEILRQWLEEHPNKSDLNAQLFPSTYDGIRRMLYKISKKAIGRSVSPHGLRHASATFYAGQGLDYFQMCKRYGWEISSKMPNIYIDRSGIKDREQTEKFINTNVTDLNQKIEILQRERIKESERNAELEARFNKLEQRFFDRAAGKGASESDIATTKRIFNARLKEQ